MTKKASIELSMNFIIVIILSMIILSAGVALTVKIFNDSKDIYELVNQKTNEAIQNSLRQGEIVSIPFSSETAGRGENADFGLGVQNVLGKKNEFRINITPLRTKPENMTTSLTLMYNKNTFELEDNNNKISNIIVSIPKNAENGLYTYTVRVEQLDGAEWIHYQSEIIYVTVK